MKHYLYILKSLKAGKYYIGSSENPERRLGYHNTIEKGYTSRYKPWEIVYKQGFDSKQQARDGERRVKNWKSREMIERIIIGRIKL